MPRVQSKVIVPCLRVHRICPGSLSLHTVSTIVVSPPIQVRSYCAGSYAFEIWMVQRSNGPLSIAKIGHSKHSDVSVTPWLFSNPVESIVSVISLIYIRIPFAFRVPFSSNILNNTYVSFLSPMLSNSWHKAVILVFAIRQPCQYYWKLAFGLGFVNIGVELNSVTHRDRNVLIHFNILIHIWSSCGYRH